METSTGYDFGTGLVLWTQDFNTKTTSYTYADSLYRLTRVDYPDGGLVQHFYNDTAGQVARTTHTRVDDYRYIIKQESLDGLGRVKSSVLAEEAGYIYHDTEYDALGRVWRVSNPYRPGETIYWTETHYDALGRITEVIQPDGALTTTDYASNRTTFIDAAGKTRMSGHDALGRLVQVIEDPLVFGYETFYGYDVLGNLTAVSQGVQNRAFTYDGLSRLLSASNPESGQTTYQYDGNGNVTLRVDARGTSTSYTYDGINRILTRSYVEGTDTALTPNVAYTYDGVGTGGANPLGRLSKVDNGVSATVVQAYDAMGRVVTSRQQFGVSAPEFHYAYDFVGNLKSLAYPSGRQIVNEYDLAGRLSGVKQGPAYYDDYYAGGWASGDRIKYSAHGEISTKRLGNGLWEHINYDPWRLQSTEAGLGTNGSDSSVLKLTYHYWGENYGKLVTENNGNMLGQDISVGILAMYQKFDYDGVNRLIQAKEVDAPGPGGSTYWTRTYSYDQYGNRTVAGHFAPQPPLPGFDASTNRFVAPADYDDAGNLQDGVAQYDAENRLASFGTTTYEYDGDGHRVKKTIGATPGTVTWHVYDAFGRLAAEYGGSPVTVSATKYLTADHLGSTRVVTDQTGAVLVRRDYLPFGEEIGPTIALRGSIPGYFLTENPAHRFTGKERDPESGLDYFGARYYSGPHGRFTSPDNPKFSEKTEPQSWNLYAYVGNNPLSYIDPLGTNWFKINDKWEWHEGKEYTCTDAKGKEQTVTSNYTHLLKFEKTGRRAADGAMIGTLTLFGNDGKAIGQSSVAYSGGGPQGYMTTPNGDYEINLNRRGGPETQQFVGDPVQLGAFRGGIQEIAPVVRNGLRYNATGEWGNFRANLIGPNDRTTPFYVHGKDLYFTEGRTYTHGCITEPNQRVLREIFKLDPRGVGEGAKNGRIAVSVAGR